MAREFEFSIIADFKDKASRGIKSLTGHLENLNDYARRGRRGLMGGMFGGFASRGAVSGPQGGIGSIVAGLGRLTAKAVAMPAKIVGAFASALPKIGDIAGGAINSVVNVLQGLAVTAANIAGHIVNTFVAAFRRVASVAGRVLGKVASYGGLAAAGATAYSVWQAAGVEEAWARVSTIAGEVPDKIRKKVKQLSYETGRKFKEVIGGYYQVLSAGVTDAGKAFQFLKSTLKGAVGGAADFETTVKAVSRTLRAMKKPVSKSMGVMDKLLKTVEMGQIEMPELAGVVGRVSKAAKLAGAGINEMLASLGLLAQTGPPEIVATQLRAFFLSLVKLPAQAKKAIKELYEQGLDVRPKVLKEKGLIEYLERLKKVPKDALTDIIPRRRGLLGARSLMDMLDKIKTTTQQIGAASGKTVSNFKKRMNTLTKQAGKAWNAIRNIATAFGAPIRDWLKSVLKDTRGEFKSWESTARAAGESVAKQFDRAWSAIKDFAGGREPTWQGIKKGISDAITQGVDAGWSYVQSLWPTVRDTILLWFNQLKPKLKGMLQGVLGGLLGGMDDMVQDAWSRLAKKMKRKKIDWYRSSGYPQSQIEKIRKRPASSFLPRNRLEAWEWGVVTEFSMLNQLEPVAKMLGRFGSRMQAGAGTGPSTATQQRIQQLKSRISRRQRRQQQRARRRQVNQVLGQIQSSFTAGLGRRAKTNIEAALTQLSRVKGKRSDDWWRKTFDEIRQHLSDITRDYDVTQQELEDLRRHVRRIRTARQ